MAKIGFLSHSDLSIFYFRAPIMRALKSRGHEVFAITPKGAYSDKIASEFETIIYEIDKASLNPLKIAKTTADLAKIFAPLNLDLLQTAAHKSNVFGTFAARHAGVGRVVNLVEGLGSFYVSENFKAKIVRLGIEMLYKRAFEMGDAAIFVNDADPDYFLAKKIIKKEKIRRIKSVGVSAENFDPKKIIPFDFTANLGENFRDKKIILMAGRALWDKGIREFYEAARILAGREDLAFIFVGDTYEGNKNSAPAEFLRDKNVAWIPWSDHLEQIMAGATIYVLPSYKEGFNRTILEAMSLAKPVIAANATGNNEAVIDGQNGLLCEPKSAADLAKKIIALLDDPKTAKKMGQTGRKMVLENFDEPLVTQKYLAVYGEFIDV